MSIPFSFIMLTGKLLATPPSTNNLSPYVTGFKSDGKEPLALKAMGKEPFSKITGVPSSKSVAIQKNGVGSLEKSWLPSKESTNSNNKFNTFCPLETPLGKPILPLFTGKVIKVFSPYSFSKKVSELLGIISLRSFKKSVFKIISSICFAE